MQQSQFDPSSTKPSGGQTAAALPVSAMFPDRASTERAYHAVTSRGYRPEDLSVLMSDDTRKRHFAGSPVEATVGNKAAEGAGVGGAIGGTVGAIAAALAALGTALVLPGLGLVVAGPLAAGLAGAGAGAAAGGVLGALVGWGIPETHVKGYEKGLKEGKVLLTVRARNPEDASYFADQWKSASGEDIYRRS